MYIILASVGWTWFAVAGAYLWFRLNRGTEAVEKHERR